MRDDEKVDKWTHRGIDGNYGYKDGYLHRYNINTGQDMGMVPSAQREYDARHRGSDSSFNSRPNTFHDSDISVGTAGVMAGISGFGGFILALLCGVGVAKLAISLLIAFGIYMVYAGIFYFLQEEALTLSSVITGDATARVARYYPIFLILMVLIITVTILVAIKYHKALSITLISSFTLVTIIREKLITGSISANGVFGGLLLSLIPVMVINLLVHLLTKKERNDYRSLIQRMAATIAAKSDKAYSRLIKTGIYQIIIGVIIFLVAFDDSLSSLIACLPLVIAGVAIGVFFIVLGVKTKHPHYYGYSRYKC